MKISHNYDGLHCPIGLASLIISFTGMWHVICFHALYSECLPIWFLPGAIISSCFFDRTLRKVRSFWGSRSRTTLRAFDVRLVISPEYWTVVELSNVDLIGMPADRSMQYLYNGMNSVLKRVFIYAMLLSVPVPKNNFQDAINSHSEKKSWTSFDAGKNYNRKSEQF